MTNRKHMTVNMTGMYDLFQKGNYIKSFKTLDDLYAYFTDDYDRRYAWGEYEPLKFCQHMNQMGYTVIQSNHLNFSEQ